MVKACPGCGTAAAPEARFCRLCGAPLRMAGHEDGPVSPLAQTVPLTGEGRPTDGFTPGDQKRSSETSRVKREEIEHLLHRHSIEPAIEEDGNGPIIIPVANDFAAPQTSELGPAPSVEKTGAPPQPPPSRRRSRVLRVVMLCMSVITVAALLAFFVYRKRAAERSNNAATAPGAEAPQPSLDAQLAEAESLLASGDTGGALKRLRAATLRDPSNARAHRLLGEALERTGARVEAIAEYSAATRQDANDTAAWRALASAQYAEERYADAVESYRRLLALTGENGLDDNGQLEYADALRLAGYTEDARVVYQKVAAGAPQDLARKATKRLAELTPAKAPAVAGNQELTHSADPAAHETRSELARNRSTETPAQSLASPSPAQSPTPQPSPKPPDSARSSVAQTDPDAYYFKAMNIVGGRDPKSLPRPELLQALQLFQNAANARGSAHREQAQKYAERLGREFDRRPRQK